MPKCVAFLLGCLVAAELSFSQSEKPSAAVRHIMTSDGVNLYVEVKGKGTPCLYLHGGPASGSYRLEKFSGDMLGRHFQMIYLDQRGVARSSSPKNGNYSMDRMVQDFEEVRAALGIKKWVTLGHSFGGILQVGYAQRHPHVIKGMIMLNCSLDIDASLEEALPKACELLNMRDSEPCTNNKMPLLDRVQVVYGKLRDKDLFWKMGYASRQSSDRMHATFDEVPNWNKDFENVCMSIKEYQGDFRKAALRMRMPVLFFYGRSDWMAGPHAYKGVDFPKMMLWGSDVGHMPFLENQADLENAIGSYGRKYKL